MIKFLNEIEKNDSFEILNSKCINWDFYKNSSILITGATVSYTHLRAHETGT